MVPPAGVVVADASWCINVFLRCGIAVSVNCVRRADGSICAAVYARSTREPCTSGIHVPRMLAYVLLRCAMFGDDEEQHGRECVVSHADVMRVLRYWCDAKQPCTLRMQYPRHGVFLPLSRAGRYLDLATGKLHAGLASIDASAHEQPLIIAEDASLHGALAAALGAHLLTHGWFWAHAEESTYPWIALNAPTYDLPVLREFTLAGEPAGEQCVHFRVVALPRRARFAAGVLAYVTEFTEQQHGAAALTTRVRVAPDRAERWALASASASASAAVEPIDFCANCVRWGTREAGACAFIVDTPPDATSLSAPSSPDANTRVMCRGVRAHDGLEAGVPGAYVGEDVVIATHFVPSGLNA